MYKANDSDRMHTFHQQKHVTNIYYISEHNNLFTTIFLHSMTTQFELRNLPRLNSQRSKAGHAPLENQNPAGQT